MSRARMLAAEAIYAFRHVIYREVVYQLHLPSERSRMHADAVGIIERLFADELDLVAGELAEHARQALESADPGHEATLKETEKRFLLIAANRSHTKTDWQDTARFCHRLLTYDDLTYGVRSDARRMLSNALQRMGSYDEAEDCLRDAIADAMSEGNYRDAVTNSTQMYMLHLFRGRLPEAQEVLRQAHELADKSGDPKTVFDVKWRSYLQPSGSGRAAEAVEVLRDAIEFGEAHGIDPGTVALARSEQASCLAALGHYEEAIQINDEVYATVAARRDESEGTLLSNRGRQCLIVGRLDEAEQNLQRALEIQQKYGNRRSEAFVRGVIADLYLQTGRLEDADAMAADAIDRAVEHGILVHAAGFQATRARAKLLAGHLDEAQELIESSRTGFISLQAQPFVAEYCDSVRLRIAACHATSRQSASRDTAVLRVEPPDARWVRTVAEILGGMQTECEARKLQAPHPLVLRVQEAKALLAELERAIKADEPAVVLRGYRPDELQPKLAAALLTSVEQSRGEVYEMLKRHPVLLQALKSRANSPP